MNKTFFAIVIVGIVILGIFVYFIFGFNDGFTTQTSQKQTAMTNSPTPPNSLKIEDIKVGTGAAVKSGDTVVINYTGTLTDGKKFDSSYDHGQPFETQIGVGKVIKGWDEGVIGMKIGGKRKLIIPPNLGYGSQSVGPIPSNSTLIFEVELVNIK